MVETTKITKKIEPTWKCKAKDCNFTAPPTLKGWNKLKGHQLYHAQRGVSKKERGICLIDQSTGEVLARTLKEAREK